MTVERYNVGISIEQADDGLWVRASDCEKALTTANTPNELAREVLRLTCQVSELQETLREAMNHLALEMTPGPEKRDFFKRATSAQRMSCYNRPQCEAGNAVEAEVRCRTCPANPNELQIWDVRSEDDVELFASVRGPMDHALAEARHYAMQITADGHTAIIEEVTRREIECITPSK